jgi:lysozyme family protein
VDIINLTVLEATAIYKAMFWAKMGGDQITDANVATVLMDASVLFGWPAAVKGMQLSVYSASRVVLSLDGNMGPKSVAALNACGRRALLQAFIFSCQVSFLDQVEKSPSKAKWLPVWTDRAGKWLTYAPSEVTQD